MTKFTFSLSLMVVFAILLVFTNRDATGGVTSIQLEPPNQVGTASWTNWLPTPDTLVPITVTLKGSSVSGGKFTFSLNDTTNYPNTCGNDGYYNPNSTPNFDMSIRVADNPPPDGCQTGQAITDQQMTMVCTLNKSDDFTYTFTLKVRCEDYGGWTQLSAKFVASDGTTVTTATPFSIPKDANNNRIADGFQGDGGTTQKAWDDNEGGPGRKGDGFTVIEELRGVLIGDNTKPTRLNPTKKDIFVYSELPQGVGYLKAGLSAKSKAPGLPNAFTVHEVKLTNFIQTTGLINFNRLGKPSWAQKPLSIDYRHEGRKTYPLQKVIWVEEVTGLMPQIRKTFSDIQFNNDEKLFGFNQPLKGFHPYNPPFVQHRAYVCTSVISNRIQTQSYNVTIQQVS